MGDPFLPFVAILSAFLSISEFFKFFACPFVKWSRKRLAHALAHFSFLDSTILEDFDLPTGLANLI